MKITLISFHILFSLLAFSAFAQEIIRQPVQRWYTTDGSNELILALGEGFALYDGQLWGLKSTGEDNFILFQGSENRSLSLKKSGEKSILVTEDKEIPVRSSKSTDLKYRKVGQTDVSKDFFREDQVLLQGVIIPNEVMPSTITIIYNHAFSDDQLQFFGDVDEKGRFKVIFPLDNPQEVMVRIGNAFFTYFSKPGAKQVMVIDESSFGGGSSSWTQVKSIDFMGDFAIENEERRLLDPEFMKVRDYFKTDSMQKTLGPDAFLDYRLDLMKKHEAFYKKYFDSIPVSLLLQEINFRDVRIYAGDDLMRYIWLNPVKENGRQTPRDIPDQYITEVKKLISGEINDIMASEYPGLMREFAMPARKSESEKTKKRGDQLIFEYLKSLDLGDSLLIDLENWKQKSVLGVPSHEMKNSEKLTALMKENQEILSNFRYQAMWENLLTKVEDLPLLPKASIISTFLDMIFLSRGQEIPKDIKEQLDHIQLDESVLAIIENKIDDFERSKNAKLVEGVAIVESADNVLSQLKEKHPGKVIYIDVWATWCGPCISEFKNADILKKEAPEGVVFAYICAQSEREAFESQIKKYKLSGEHYFLDQEAYQQFDKELNITGFPTYLLITKEGKLIREGIHRPSSGEQLIEQLNGFVSR